MSCCTGLSNCGCDSCRVAFSPYRGTCTDVGTSTVAYLAGYDAQFCPTRFSAGGGLLQSVEDGSGNFQISFSQSPQVDLPDTSVLEDATFGNLVIIGSDDKLTRLVGPATSLLFMQTNAAGQLFLGDPPPAVVPDPLAIDNLTVGTLATIANADITGSVTLSGLAAGTLVEIVGLDGSNNVIKQSVSELTTQCAQFFESPTSPSASYPNENKTGGQNLVIGNRLFDSGASIINVTNSETLTVAVAGDYEIQWGAMCVKSGAGEWLTGIQLLINGITVSNGGINPNRQVLTSQNVVTVSASWMRSLAMGDTIQLMLNPAAGGTPETYEVWLNATRVNV